MFEFNLKEENLRYSILTYVSTIQVYKPLGSASRGHLAAQFSFLTVKDVVLSSNSSGPLPRSIWWSTETMWAFLFFFFLRRRGPTPEPEYFKMWRVYPRDNTNRGYDDLSSLELVKKDHVTFWPFKDEILSYRGAIPNWLLLGNDHLASTVTTAVVFLHHCSPAAVHQQLFSDFWHKHIKIFYPLLRGTKVHT